MPGIHAYTTRPGLYILRNIGGPSVAYQVTPSGVRLLRARGYGPGDHLPVAEFHDLNARDYLTTGGGGVWDSESGTWQDQGAWAAATEQRRMRRRRAVVRETLEEAFAGMRQRRLAMRAVAKAVGAAHAINPACWSLALHAGSAVPIRLHVGRLEVLGIGRDGSYRILAHEPLVPPRVLARLRADRAVGRRHRHKIWPEAIEITLAPGNLYQLESFELPHMHAVSAMAYLTAQSPYARTQAPGIVNYLRSEGLTVPSPAN